MIKFKEQVHPVGQLNINMLPLVDIIFNLLIFLLIAATISAKSIPFDLPQSSSAETASVKTWELMVNRQGILFFNQVRISIKRLEKILESEKNKADSAPKTILIQAHKEVPFGVFVSVMDVIRKAGGYHLMIATDPTSRDK